jgi:hypothetical protein
VAEIPADNAPARALFAACGWREERTYVDLACDVPAASPAPAEMVVPVTVEDLRDVALPEADAPRSWGRSRGTLLNRAERLSGLAIAAGERLEASVLFAARRGHHDDLEPVSGTRRRRERGARRLVARAGASRARPDEDSHGFNGDEVAIATLHRLGFASARETIGVVTTAPTR